MWADRRSLSRFICHATLLTIHERATQLSVVKTAVLQDAIRTTGTGDDPDTYDTACLLYTSDAADE